MSQKKKKLEMLEKARVYLQQIEATGDAEHDSFIVGYVDNPPGELMTVQGGTSASCQCSLPNLLVTLAEKSALLLVGILNAAELIKERQGLKAADIVAPISDVHKN